MIISLGEGKFVISHGARIGLSTKQLMILFLLINLKVLWMVNFTTQISFFRLSQFTTHTAKGSIR